MSIEIITTFESAEALRIAAKSFGIKPSKLNEARESYGLTKDGVFTAVYPVPDPNLTVEEMADPNNTKPNFSHIVAETNHGEKISLSKLQAYGFEGTLTEAALCVKERLDKPGYYSLKGVKCFNPQLTGDQATMGFKLLGKNFKVTEKPDCIVTDYVEGGFTSEQAAIDALIPRTFYKITLV